jgi:hypothetical protein
MNLKWLSTFFMEFVQFMNVSNVSPFLNYKGLWSYQANYRFSPSFSIIMLWSTTHAINTFVITSLFHCLL